MSLEAIAAYPIVRRNLRYPPNAVPDPGINLRRRPPEPEPPPAVMEIRPDHTDDPPVDPMDAAFGPVVHPDERWIKIRDIQFAAGRYYGVRMAELLSVRRAAPIVRARHVAMWLCKMHTHKSLAEIGRRSGGRDHTTVISACDKITAAIIFDPDIAADIAAIEKSLGLGRD